MSVLGDLLIFDVDFVFAYVLNEKSLLVNVPVDLGVTFAQRGAVLSQKEIRGII